MRKLLVTGGAGFIGGNFVRHLLATDPAVEIINLDKLTYAGTLATLENLPDASRHHFVQGDICDRPLIDSLLREHGIDTIAHFAAESHVDRSITGPAEFIRTNVVGTFTLLDAARSYWLDECRLGADAVRFHHVSTDEVFGSLGASDPAFNETTRYDPRSPYSASKAGSDHLVQAYHHTYGLPITISNCSNNYGPYHFPEKLIPLLIINALHGRPLPIYGDGRNVRDWLYVVDHCRGIESVLRRGQVGETYNIGGRNEWRNLDLCHVLCRLVDEAFAADSNLAQRYPLAAAAQGAATADTITFVKDRPGHDQRYAIDASRIERELGFVPQETFESGIRKTLRWYFDNPAWWQSVMNEDYRGWIDAQYARRVASI